MTTREKFLDCVHCGLCLSACPTYVELGTEMDSPRGRIYLMRGVEERTIDLTPDVVRHLDLCLGCRACETACPSGVHYGELLESARSFVETYHRRGWRERTQRRLMAFVFPRPQLLRLLLGPLRVLDVMGLLDSLRRRNRFVAMLPRLRWWAPLQANYPAPRSAAPSRHVALLTGCVQQVLFAETNRATVRVLVRNGCHVEAPPAQACCGALHVHAGEREQAQACARQNVDAFPADVDAIVVNSAGCGAMLKEYVQLLADDPDYAERARAFSAKVRDASEWLAASPLVPPHGRVDARVTYHDACHLAHGQGVREAPRQLLRQIRGIELVELAESDTCCGSAGSYNLSEPEMATRLGDRKAAHVRDTKATVVAVANPGCAMQIASRLRAAGSSIEVVHPIELLDRAYRPEERA